jgi:hypothetical protein
MKLVENLRAIETGNRCIVEDSLHTISYNTMPSSEYEIKYAKEYSIIVKIGANQWIEEDIIRTSGGRVIDHALEDMKHAIVEHIYGEINRDLRELYFLMRREQSYRENPSMKKLEEIMGKITL